MNFSLETQKMAQPWYMEVTKEEPQRNKIQKKLTSNLLLENILQIS